MKDGVIEWQKHTLKQNKTKQVGGGGEEGGRGRRGKEGVEGFW